MQTNDAFTLVPVPGIVGIILDGGERADEAMYYLLRQCLYLPLKRRYEIFQHRLLDDFDDILDDFFFYLRDGGDRHCGDDQSDEDDQPDGCEQTYGDVGDRECSEPESEDRSPYPSLRRIRNREASVQWLLRTFRNYLAKRADREETLSSTGLDPDCVPDADVPTSILTDEEKLTFASNLLAYALQELPPRDGFILLRSLLALLNKGKSLPNEEMAEALGMSDISYRVSVHRVKSHLARYRTRLLQGGPLRLDGPHREMAQRIHEDFLNLYPTLLHYYTQSINTLVPDRADAVNRLRQCHLTATGNLLHEPTAPYEGSYSKAALWNLMERLL